MKKILLPLSMIPTVIISHFSTANEAGNIYTCDQFVEILSNKHNTYGGHYYKIQNNLDCSDSKSINPIGGNSLTVDGQGNTISFLKLNGSIFYSLDNSVIKDIHFSKPQFSIPFDKTTSLLADNFSESKLVNLSVTEPNSNGAPFSYIVGGLVRSTLRSFIFDGNGLEFKGDSLSISNSQDSVIDDIQISNAKHSVSNMSSSYGLLIGSATRSQISTVKLSSIDVEWFGKFSGWRSGYSFLIGSTYNTKVNSVQISNITYPGPSNRVGLVTVQDHRLLTEQDTYFSNIDHEFWSVEDEALNRQPFSLLVNMDYSPDYSSVLNNIKPSGSVVPAYPPEVCKPYVHRDTYYSLPSTDI